MEINFSGNLHLATMLPEVPKMNPLFLIHRCWVLGREIKDYVTHFD